MVREKARAYRGRGGVAEKRQEECQNRGNSMAENSKGSGIENSMGVGNGKGNFGVAIKGKRTAEEERSKKIARGIRMPGQKGIASKVR